MRLVFFVTAFVAICLPLQAQPGNARCGVEWNIDNLSKIGGHPVSVYGSPVVKDFPEGRAMVFDGVDDGVIVHGCPLDASAGFTIEIFVRPDSSYPKNIEQRFLHIQHPGNKYRRMLLELRLTGKHEWFVDTHIRADSMKLTCLARDFPHPVNAWHHIAFVYSNGVAAHYVDGVKEMTGRIDYIPVDSANVSIGMRMDKRSYFKGAIGTMRMTRRALDPSEFMARARPAPRAIAQEPLFADDFTVDTKNWTAEFEDASGSAVTVRDGVLDLSASAGATVWYARRLSGDVQITFDVTVVDAGGANDRVSDLNMFWMASDSGRGDLRARSGKLSAYDDLDLYYAGIGGHDNTTTRFRKYRSTGEKPVLQEYTDAGHLLKGNTPYTVAIIAHEGLTRLFVNDRLFFDYPDTAAYTAGYFGFRTTKSHLRIDNFAVHGISRACSPLFLDAAKIRNAHAALQANTQGLAKQIGMFLRQADSLLGVKPLSVMDKVQTPPGGDKHDFLSMGPYWWPDSSKADGLPYVRFDGRRNPEYHTITDQEYFTRTIYAAEKLSVAYAVSDDRRYSAKAARMLRVWFLDEATRMNPNLNHAQYIPGLNTGRGIGIIETREIFKLLDALCLLEPSAEWTKDDATRMRTWIEDYYRWLTTHPYGIDESNEKNNHGTWYDVQVTSLALYLGKKDAARKYLEQAKEKRIGSQIEPDGRQPLELARTRSWAYSLMNLTAFFHLAQLGERVDVDLWNYESPKGGSLRKALEYLLRYAVDPAKWEYQNLHPIEPHTLVPLIMKGQKRFANEKYQEWLTTIPASKKDPGTEGLYQ
jgi:hypothetical protein